MDGSMQLTRCTDNRGEKENRDSESTRSVTADPMKVEKYAIRQRQQKDLRVTSHNAVQLSGQHLPTECK